MAKQMLGRGGESSDIMVVTNSARQNGGEFNRATGSLPGATLSFLYAGRGESGRSRRVGNKILVGLRVVIMEQAKARRRVEVQPGCRGEWGTVRQGEKFRGSNGVQRVIASKKSGTIS